MNKLLLLVIMMATWMVVSCGTTDGTKAGPELGYYEDKKEMKEGRRREGVGFCYL